MTKAGEQIAAHAKSLIGTPFRFGGREPSSGLDCVGVVLESLKHVGIAAGLTPQYRLRNSSMAELRAYAAALRLAEVEDDLLAGDILVAQPAAAMLHLAIRVEASSAVHAHAGLRRVTLSPLPLPWPLLACWRLP